MNVKRLWLGIAVTSLTAATIVACGGGGGGGESFQVSSGTLISNVTVVDTRNGSLSAPMSVVVDGGKITRITASVLSTTGAASSVDGTGKFLVPGFVDMHTHSMVRVDQNPTYFPLMIANGVTAFREMGEFPGSFPSMVARAKQVNADRAAGRLDAPEVLLVPSDIYAAATSPATAIQAVDTQKALGVDFIKTISATRDAQLAFLTQSKAQGLHLAGHLSPAVSAAESSQAGWKTIEHLGSGIGILLDCSGDETAFRQSIVSAAGANAPAFPSDPTSLQRVLDTYSTTRCQALAQTFVQNGTWHVPTLRRVRGLDITDDPLLVTDPNLIYVDKARLALWAGSLQTYSNRPAAAKASLRQLYALKQSVVKMMKQAGVKMMAGSDAGLNSVWVIPGFGLHEDFHELAAAGLTPLEILQMTTLNPAEFLGRQSSMGTVEEGKNADLVLLDANPTASAANLDKIAAVFNRGKYFSKTALDKLKADVAAAYAAQPLQEIPAHILDAEAGHVD